MADDFNVCVWQHRASMHQNALIKGLREETKLIWIIENPQLSLERLNMGWEDSDVEPDVFLSDVGDIASFIRTLDKDTVHIFGGFAVSRKLRFALRTCQEHNFRTYIQSEAFEFTGFKGKVRLIRAFWERKCGIGRRLSGIFAIGDLSARFFTKVGYP